MSGTLKRVKIRNIRQLEEKVRVSNEDFNTESIALLRHHLHTDIDFLGDVSMNHESDR